MEKVRKYGMAVSKLYKEEGAASTKAAAYRARIRAEIDSLSSSSVDRDELLECMWQLAYYPAARCAQMDDHLRLVLSLLAGELQLMTPLSSAAFVYVGDLHRYQDTPLSASLARLYYTRAMIEEPSAARPLNQLSIMMDALPAVRCLLLAAGCSKKFRVTERNLEGRLAKMKQSSSASLVRLAVLIDAAMTEKKAEEEGFTTAAKEWTEELKEFAAAMRGEERKVKSPSPPKTKKNAGAELLQQLQKGGQGEGEKEEGEGQREEDRLMQLHCISLAVGVAHPSNSSALIDLIQSSLLILLEKKEREEKEEEVIKIGSRRRRASESDEEERVIRGRRRRGSDDDEEEKKGEEKEEEQSGGEEKDQPPAVSPCLLSALSLALEWIARVDRARMEGNARYEKMKVMREKMKLDQLVSAVLLRLNEIGGLTERVDCLLDADAARKSLIQWRVVERLRLAEGEEEMGREWTAMWTATILREEEGSIQQSPSGAFVARNDHSIMRKMAALHMSAQSSKSERPLSVVLQANVLERRLGKIRSLADRSHLIWYVPASELARLDETKSASKAARDALRFIETEQHTRLRVLPAGGIAEALARATAENAPTALLSLDTVKDSDSLPPHTQCLHVDSFAHSYK